MITTIESFRVDFTVRKPNYLEIRQGRVSNRPLSKQQLIVKKLLFSFCFKKKGTRPF